MSGWVEWELLPHVLLAQMPSWLKRIGLACFQFMHLLVSCRRTSEGSGYALGPPEGHFLQSRNLVTRIHLSSLSCHHLFLLSWPDQLQNVECLPEAELQVKVCPSSHQLGSQMARLGPSRSIKAGPWLHLCNSWVLQAQFHFNWYHQSETSQRLCPARLAKP